MMFDPGQLLLKTAANYIAFKVVKSTVDGAINIKQNSDQGLKAARCVFCFKVWSYNPDKCPHCHCKTLKKLYRDYEFKKPQDDFNVNTGLILGGV